MMGVMGALELLPASETPEELQQYQHIATGSARDMMRLVNNILVLSELRAGKLRLQAQRFSRDTAVRLEQHFGPQARAKGWPSIWSSTASCRTAYGDGEVRAKHLSSARQRGQVHLAGAVTLRFGGAVEQRQVQLEVEVIDSGIGFSDADQAYLYHQFRQVDGSMTRRYGGLGIGLAISRGLIEVFGGQLSQQSRPGLGSRFCIRVRFPLHGPEQMLASQPNGKPPSAPIA